MAIPTSHAVLSLQCHVIQLSGIDKLRIQLFMATNTIVHNHLRTHRMSLYHLSLAIGHKYGYMLHPIQTLECPFLHKVFLWHMTIITRCITPVRTMHPRRIIWRHDVTIHTCRWFIRKIGMSTKQITDEQNTSNNSSGYDGQYHLMSLRNSHNNGIFRHIIRLFFRRFKTHLFRISTTATAFVSISHKSENQLNTKIAHRFFNSKYFLNFFATLFSDRYTS